MQWINPTQAQLLQEASYLIDEGDNTEYTRGVLEILSAFMTRDNDMCAADAAIELAKLLGIPEDNIKKLY